MTPVAGTCQNKTSPSSIQEVLSFLFGEWLHINAVTGRAYTKGTSKRVIFTTRMFHS